MKGREDSDRMLLSFLGGCICLNQAELWFVFFRNKQFTEEFERLGSSVCAECSPVWFVLKRLSVIGHFLRIKGTLSLCFMCFGGHRKC